MRSLIMAAGGSGGHLVPAIALLQNDKLNGFNSAIITTSKAVDKRLSRKYPNFEFIHQAVIAFDSGVKNKLKSILSIFLSVPRTIRYFYTERCRCLFSTGGFGCVGSVLGASILGIPILFHESNSVPGKATRILSNMLDTLYVTSLSSHPFLNKKAFKKVGFPIRGDFNPISKESAKEKLGIPSDSTALLVMGASQGAEALNEWVANNDSFFEERNIYVTCLTGAQGAALNSESKYIRFETFSDDMDVLLSAADLVISRSGAGSIAEIAYSQTPAVLVPFPQSALNHQRLNAEQFSTGGCAVTLEQTHIEFLQNTINELLKNESEIQAMILAQSRWNIDQSVTPIIADILTFINQHPRV